MHFPANQALRCLPRALTTIGYVVCAPNKSKISGDWLEGKAQFQVGHDSYAALWFQPLSLLPVSECTVSWVPVSLQGSWPHAVMILAYVNCGIHEPRNSSLATVNQLRVGDVSRTKIPVTYFLQLLAVIHIPLSLHGRKGLKWKLAWSPFIFSSAVFCSVSVSWFTMRP